MKFPVKLAVALTAIALAAPAQAQFGGLVKKAKEKAAKAVAGDAAQQSGVMQPAGSCGITPTFDATTIELNASNLDKVVKAFTAVRTAGDKNGRNKLAAQRDGDRARLEELESDRSVSEAEESQRQYNECRQQAYSEIMQKHAAEKGPGIMADYSRALRTHNDKIAAYEAKGDTAHANALKDSTYTVIMTVVGATPQDSAAVDAKCGKPPRASKRVAERDSLRRVVREESDSIRVLDEDAEDQVRAASGLTNRQLAAARERIETYLRNGQPCGFTKSEVDALNARKSELQKLM